MPEFFLGIDVGATKTHALLADAQGNALGVGQSGPGNHEAVGWDGLRRVLHEATDQALAHAALDRAQLAGAGFGIAGYDWPGDDTPTRQAIAALGLPCPYGLVNDVMLGLYAGSQAGWGVVVGAGTGCNCWGCDREGTLGRVTGEGWYFAEHGGASEIIISAIQAISRAWSRRGPETRLTQAFVDLLGAENVLDLLAGLARGRYTPEASAAPLIFQIAAEGDAVAQELIRWAGQGLGDLAIGVIRQLHFETETFELVLAGSVFNGSPVLAETVARAVHPVAPGARLVRLEAPPVVGGVILAMQETGHETAPVRPALLASTRLLWSAGEA